MCFCVHLFIVVRPWALFLHRLTGAGTRTTYVLWPSRFSTTSSVVLWYFLGFTPVLWNHRLPSTTSTGTACMEFSTVQSWLIPDLPISFDQNHYYDVSELLFFVSCCLQWEDEQAAGAVCWSACRNPRDDSGKHRSDCGTEAGIVDYRTSYSLFCCFEHFPLKLVICFHLRQSQGTLLLHRKLPRQLRPAEPRVRAGWGRSVGNMPAWSSQGWRSLTLSSSAP